VIRSCVCSATCSTLNSGQKPGSSRCCAECTAEIEQAMERPPQCYRRHLRICFATCYAEMTPQLIEQEAALLASLQQQGESHGTAQAR